MNKNVCKILLYIVIYFVFSFLIEEIEERFEKKSFIINSKILINATICTLILTEIHKAVL